MTYKINKRACNEIVVPASYLKKRGIYIYETATFHTVNNGCFSVLSGRLGWEHFEFG